MRVPGFARAGGVLSDPSARWYFLGLSGSLLGTWMQSAAQGWLLWELTHSPAALGVMGLFQTLPYAVVSPWGGVIADRFDRRRWLLAIQIAGLLMAVALGTLAALGLVRPWHIDLLALLLGVVAALEIPAQRAFLGDIGDLDKLRSSQSLQTGLNQSARLLGPSLVGIIIAAFGVTPVFWLNAASFLLAVAGLVAVDSHQERSTRTAGAWAELKEGIHFIQQSPAAQNLIVMSSLLMAFGSSIAQLFPAIASLVLHGNATVYGRLLGSVGAGAILGVLAVTPLANRRNDTGRVIAIAAWGAAGAYAVVALSHSLMLTMVAIAAASMAYPVLNTAVGTVLQVTAPATMRARVVSLWLAVSQGFTPIAAVTLGWLAQHWGVPQAILTNVCLLTLGVALLLWWRPSFWTWQDPTLHSFAVDDTEGPDSMPPPGV